MYHTTAELRYLRRVRPQCGPGLDQSPVYLALLLEFFVYMKIICGIVDYCKYL